MLLAGRLTELGSRPENTVTTQDPTTPRNSTPTVFGTLAIGCFSYSVIALLLLHLLRRDYDPRIHMISDYAVGPYGWVMTTCFLAMGCGLLMLLRGLFRHGPRSGVAKIGTLLLVIPAIGVGVSAMFPTDLLGAPSTRSGEIHDMSFLVNIVGIMLSAVLVSFSFGSDSRWRTYQRTALVLALLLVIAFGLQLLTLRRGMPYGYTNRLFVIVLFGWLFDTAIRLRAVERDSRRSPADNG